MSNLQHSPAMILRKKLVDLSIGSLPSLGQSWPIGVNLELETPDNTITVYDTTGESVRYMPGDYTLHHGIQIRIRSNSQLTGYVKSSDIQEVLNLTLYRDNVTLDSLNYCIQCASKISDIIPLYREAQISSRFLHTINCLLHVKSAD